MFFAILSHSFAGLYLFFFYLITTIFSGRIILGKFLIEPCFMMYLLSSIWVTMLITHFWQVFPFYNLWFSWVFKRYKMGTLARNGLVFTTSCFQGTHFFITKIFVRIFLFLFFYYCCYFQQKGQIKNKIQKQAPEMFRKEGVPRNFAKFKGKLLYQSLFSNKVAAATLLKKKLWHRCFPVNFPTFLTTPFLQNISGRLLLKIMLRSGPVPIFLMTTHLSQ